MTPPREGGAECGNTLTEPHWPIITCVREPQHPGLHGGWHDDEWFNWSDDYGVAP